MHSVLTLLLSLLLLKSEITFQISRSRLIWKQISRHGIQTILAALLHCKGNCGHTLRASREQLDNAWLYGILNRPACPCVYDEEWKIERRKKHRIWCTIMQFPRGWDGVFIFIYKSMKAVCVCVCVCVCVYMRDREPLALTPAFIVVGLK